MENHELGTHNDKTCPNSSTGNTQQFILPICPNRPFITVEHGRKIKKFKLLLQHFREETQ